MKRIQMIVGSDGSKAHYVLDRETLLTISLRDLSVLYRADLLENFFPPTRLRTRPRLFSSRRLRFFGFPAGMTVTLPSGEERSLLVSDSGKLCLGRTNEPVNSIINRYG